MSALSPAASHLLENLESFLALKVQRRVVGAHLRVHPVQHDAENHEPRRLEDAGEDDRGELDAHAGRLWRGATIIASAVSRAKRRVSSTSRAVRPGDDLEQMPARIFEIDCAATVVAVALHG